MENKSQWKNIIQLPITCCWKIPFFQTSKTQVNEKKPAIFGSDFVNGCGPSVHDRNEWSSSSLQWNSTAEDFSKSILAHPKFHFWCFDHEELFEANDFGLQKSAFSMPHLHVLKAGIFGGEALSSLWWDMFLVKN